MGLGFYEILIILGVALLVLGPEKFPGFAKMAIRAVHDLRSYMDEMKRDIAGELRPMKDEIRKLSQIDPMSFDAPPKPAPAPSAHPNVPDTEPPTPEKDEKAPEEKEDESQADQNSSTP